MRDTPLCDDERMLIFKRAHKKNAPARKTLTADVF